MPFSVGVLESSFYDDNSITDEQIVIFERISMLLKQEQLQQIIGQ